MSTATRSALSTMLCTAALFGVTEVGRAAVGERHPEIAVGRQVTQNLQILGLRRTQEIVAGFSVLTFAPPSPSNDDAYLLRVTECRGVIVAVERGYVSSAPGLVERALREFAEPSRQETRERVEMIASWLDPHGDAQGELPSAGHAVISFTRRGETAGPVQIGGKLYSDRRVTLSFLPGSVAVKDELVVNVRNELRPLTTVFSCR